jgi:hypothetical protein
MSGKGPRPQTVDDLKPLLGASVDDVAPIMRVSRGKLFQMCQRGEVPCKRYDGRIVICVQELLRDMGVKP